MENLYDNFLIKYCEEQVEKHTEILNDQKWKLKHLKFQAIMGKREDPVYREFFTDLYNYSGLADIVPFDEWLIKPKWHEEYYDTECEKLAMNNIIEFYEFEINREEGNQYGW